MKIRMTIAAVAAVLMATSATHSQESEGAHAAPMSGIFEEAIILWPSSPEFPRQSCMGESVSIQGIPESFDAARARDVLSCGADVMGALSNLISVCYDDDKRYSEGDSNPEGKVCECKVSIDIPPCQWVDKD